jgi:hypothetical protein
MQDNVVTMPQVAYQDAFQPPIIEAHENMACVDLARCTFIFKGFKIPGAMLAEAILQPLAQRAGQGDQFAAAKLNSLRE